MTGNRREVLHTTIVLAAIIAWIRYGVITMLSLPVQDLPNIPAGTLYFVPAGVAFAASLSLLVSRERSPGDIIIFPLVISAALVDMFVHTQISTYVAMGFYTVAGAIAFFANRAPEQQHPTELNWNMPLWWFLILLFGTCATILRFLVALFYYPIPTTIQVSTYAIPALIMLIGGAGLSVRGGRRSSFKLVIAFISIVGGAIDLLLPGIPTFYIASLLYLVAGGLVIFRLSLVNGGVTLD
jgi:hypothetical protein